MKKEYREEREWPLNKEQRRALVNHEMTVLGKKEDQVMHIELGQRDSQSI
jgi:hypothetical protein